MELTHFYESIFFYLALNNVITDQMQKIVIAKSSGLIKYTRYKLSRLVSLFNSISLCRLFKAKAILLEEQ